MTPAPPPASSQWKQLAPPLMTALGAVGFGVGLVVMLWGYKADPNSETFVERPETIAWIVSLAFSVAFWAAASPLLWSDVSSFRQAKDGRSPIRPSDKVALGLGVIAFFAMLGAPILVSKGIHTFDIPLNHSFGRFRTLQVIAGLLVVLPGLLSMWLHPLHFSRLVGNMGSTSDAASTQPREEERVRTADDFVSDRQALLRAGSILGATVGLVALATGALRNALVTAGYETTAPSATAVLAYAAGATAMLAIAYVPAYLSMQRAGRDLIDRYVQKQLPGSPNYDTYRKTRDDWEDHLQLKVGPVDSLKIGTAVLTPIVTGLATVLIGVKF
jgi:hypothetical protein